MKAYVIGGIGNIQLNLMRNATDDINETLAYYYPLLSRYCTMLIGDRSEAEKIARKTLEDHYQMNGLAPSRLMRVILKRDVLNRCTLFKQVQIFDRPPVKVPFNR